MSVTDKIFFSATLIEVAGCSADTFRAWRNRNGLFPETKGKSGWNKFSIVDMLVTAVITDITKRGVSAQTAIDAAAQMSELLAELCDVTISAKDADNIEAIATQILQKWTRMKDFPLLVITPFHNSGPSVKLVESTLPVLLLFGDSPRNKTAITSFAAIVVYLAEMLPFVLAKLIMFDSEFVNAEGRKHYRLGYIAAHHNGEKPAKKARSSRAKAKSTAKNRKSSK